KEFLPRVEIPFVLTSVGALADPTTAEQLMTPHLHVTNGAIGGFDLLEAVADQLDHVSITTSKAPGGLIQSWMSQHEANRLEELTEAESMLRAKPTVAIQKFPGTVNVAVALAYAARGSKALTTSLQRVNVQLGADPVRTDAAHRMEV